jgi:hypothetical protein
VTRCWRINEVVHTIFTKKTKCEMCVFVVRNTKLKEKNQLVKGLLK